MISEAKSVESAIARGLMGEKLNNEHKYYSVVESSIINIMSVLDGPIKKVIEKPKVKQKPVYGGKNEPKSDVVVITTTGSIYKFSVKTELDKAYIHTSNSYEDTIKLILESSFSKYLSDDEKQLIMDTCSKFLVKVSRFEDWNTAKGGYSEYVDYYFSKGLESQMIKWVGLERTLQIKNAIKLKYQTTVESGKTPYKDFLHIAEPAIQYMLGILMENEKFANGFIFEMLTGVEKFGEDSYASANYVVSSDGVWKLDNPDCDLVKYKLEKYRNGKVGRLQNVPRVGLSKKIVKEESIDTIVNSFPTADMSMKL